MNGQTETVRAKGRGEFETELITELAKELAESGVKLGNHLLISNGHPAVVVHSSTGTYLLTVEKVSGAVIKKAEQYSSDGGD